MRESSNLNLDLHHQHEDHFHGPSSSSSSSLAAPPPPFHFLATSNRIHDWNQHLLLNIGDDQFNMAPREFMMPMVQDLGNIFQWPTAAADQQGYMMNHCSSQEQLASAAKSVKEELAGVDLGQQNYHVGGFDHDHHHPMGNLGGSSGFGRSGMGFGTVLPTASIVSAGGPNLQLPALPYSSSLGVDRVRALDLFSSSGRFGRTLCQPAAAAVDHSMALLRREDLAYGLGHQVQAASLSQKQQVPPSSFSGVHSNGNLEYKATQSVAKKPRLESRASFSTPFKVRKEKLGDRIAALQQLVAPFGKTDTASVLMEAIGYIKFLQDQVETLSVPYMRSSNNKKMRTSVETSTEEREEPKLDLRSRGLCLVPLSCTSYVTEENGGVWSPPNYRGAT